MLIHKSVLAIAFVISNGRLDTRYARTYLRAVDYIHAYRLLESAINHVYGLYFIFITPYWTRAHIVGENIQIFARGYLNKIILFSSECCDINNSVAGRSVFYGSAAALRVFNAPADNVLSPEESRRLHFHCKSLLPRHGCRSVLSVPAHSFSLPVPSRGNRISVSRSFDIARSIRAFGVSCLVHKNMSVLLLMHLLLIRSRLN